MYNSNYVYVVVECLYVCVCVYVKEDREQILMLMMPHNGIQNISAADLCLLLLLLLPLMVYVCV